MSETRKLAAILATDVLGYSRLVGEDETRRAVSAHILFPPSATVLCSPRRG